jgi:ribonuclease P protein component
MAFWRGIPPRGRKLAGPYHKEFDVRYEIQYNNTLEQEAQKNPWFQATDEIKEWQGRFAQAQAQGASQAYRITMTEAFRRKDRLCKTRDFRRVYSRGTSFRNSFLALWVAPNSLENTRLGVVVGSRCARLASRRNRLKRVLREVFRKNRAHLRKGLDLVVVVKTDPGAQGSYSTIEHLFLRLSKTGGIFL